MTGSGSATPVQRWIWAMRWRCMTIPKKDPKYSGMAVAMRTPNKTALAQWAPRWTRSKRSIPNVASDLTRGVGISVR